MTPEELIRSIYLGDRAVKAIHVEAWDRVVKIKVSSISRIRDPDGNWNYYTDEDIEDGFLVFEGVSGFSIKPPGPVPNDFIGGFEVRRLPDDAAAPYEFAISVGSVDDKANHTQVELTIIGESLSLEDPKRPGLKIVD